MLICMASLSAVYFVINWLLGNDLFKYSACGAILVTSNVCLYCSLYVCCYSSVCLSVSALNPPVGITFVESCGSSGFFVCPFHGFTSAWSLYYLALISLVW